MAGRSKGRVKDSPEQKAEKLEARRIEQAEEEAVIWQGIEAKAEQALVSLHKKGRPSKYSPELAEKIFTLLASGMSMARICQREDMPHVATVARWSVESSAFREGYTRAREAQADALFDECVDIADDAAQDVTTDEDGKLVFNNVAVQRAKLRIETRLRVAGKLNQRYADRPLIGDGANVTVNNNTLTLDARTLDPDQRDKLRNLLLIAKGGES